MNVNRLVVIGLIALVALLLLSKGGVPKLGGSTYRWNTTIVSNESIGATIRNVVSSNGATHYVGIQNNSNQTVFCLLDGVTAASDSTVTSTSAQPVGIRIAATSTNAQGSLYEIYDYSGNINCTAAANASSTLIIGR